MIERHLADGGMASVYHATHPLIGKQAAVKVLSSALAHSDIMIGRFLREARAVNQIRHQNIVDIFAFGQLADGRHYFVMEKLEGETLLDRMERGPLLLAETVDILVQVAEALEAAHAHQIAHLDLKPENVFLVPGRGGKPIVKLLDFGIAKLLSGEQGESSGDFCGTPDYASPEQARVLGSIDHRSDVYSFGVVAYELLVGRRPFEAATPLATLFKHMSEEAPRPSSIVPTLLPELDTLLVEMLSKAPENRPTMTEIVARLLAACPPTPTFLSESQLLVLAEASGPITLDVSPLSSRSRLDARMLYAGLGVALLLVGAGFAFHRAPAPVVAAAAPVVAAVAPVVVTAPFAAVPLVETPVARPVAHRGHRATTLFVPAAVRAQGADYVLDYAGKHR
ncbi:MAG: serine/threonine-protein kinase [Polyangia bacterium]